MKLDERKLSLPNITVLHDKKYRCKVYRKNTYEPGAPRWDRITSNAYGKDSGLAELPNLEKLKPGSFVVVMDSGR